MSALPPKKGSNKVRPSLRGVAMQDIVRGSERLRTWPRKRGTPKNPTTLKNIKWFTETQRATKYLDAKSYAQIAAATEKTPLLPRDLMTMIHAGRIGVFVLPNGKVIYTMAVRRDVSESLDAITQAEGMMLIRGPDGWEAIDPASLITGGTVANGIDDFSQMYPGNSSSNMGPNFGDGRFVVPQADVTIKAIRHYSRSTDPTGQYTPFVYSATATGGGGTLLRKGPTRTGIVPGYLDLPLDSDLTVAAGTPIIMGWVKYGGSTIQVGGALTVQVPYFNASSANPPTSPTWLYGNASWHCFAARTWDL